MKKRSPSARTKEYLRELGFVVDDVERQIPGANLKKDLYGCFDLLAIKVGEGIIGVQVTSLSNFASRKRKVLDSPHLPLWFACGGRAIVHAWGKLGPRGEPKVWTLKAWEATREHLAI